MPPMKEKIKNLFNFLGRAWSCGIRGKIGIVFAMFAMFMFIGLFCGDVNIQRFISNIHHLNRAHELLATEQHTLETLERHIRLIQNYSPDFTEELGLKHLNVGDPNIKILKI